MNFQKRTCIYIYIIYKMQKYNYFLQTVSSCLCSCFYLQYIAVTNETKESYEI